MLADLRYAARRLTRTASFTAAAVTTLALGIGATTNTLGSDYLFGTTAHDLRIISAATLLLAVTALAAGYMPARRAAALHPGAALRVE